jgi:tRNA pseudouridine13 synthase
MKLRQRHEDFRVEEISELDIKDSGRYKLYLLEKRGMETFYLLAYLAKQNGIPVTDFGIAGLKDKHAITKQYLTISASNDIKTLHEKGFDLKLLGYVDERLEIGSLQGNRFEITIRNVKKGELDGIYNKASDIEKIGVPNYFDSQRFGSVIKNEFIVKHAVKGDFETAVRTFMTSYTKSEPARIKGEKRMIAERWPNIKNLQVKTTSLSNVIAEYKRTGDWAAAYRRMPTNIRKMMLSAYQSYLWNECVKAVLKKVLKHDQMYKIDYNVGDLVFYKDIRESQLKEVPETIRLIGPRMDMTEAEEKVIGQVLNKEGLKLKDFDIQDKTGDFFGVRERFVIVHPTGFNIGEPQVDEMNDRGKKNILKITLSFELPKGSYATIVTKRIFNR